MDTIRDMESFVSKSSFYGKNVYLENVLRTYKVEAEYSLNGPLYSNYNHHSEGSRLAENSRPREDNVMPKLPNRSVESVNRFQTLSGTEKNLGSCVSSNDKVRNRSRFNNFSQISDNGCPNFRERTQYATDLEASKTFSMSCRLNESKRIHSVPRYRPCDFPSDVDVKLNSRDSDVALKNEKRSCDVGLYVGPVLVPADQSAVELSETEVEGHRICGFSVGGEMRLCLPQIINIILDRFSVDEIRPIYDELHVFCALCTNAQLDILKRAGVLPMGAPSCGLITNTDAERLCAKLLRQCHDSGYVKITESKRNMHVLHECFGKCYGVFRTSDYVAECSNAISCVECGRELTPAQFVCHSHASQENRVLHWGFDSARWRNYIMINEEYYEGSRNSERDGLTLEMAEKMLKNIKMKSSSTDLRKRHMVDNVTDEEVSPVKRVKEESVVIYGDGKENGRSLAPDKENGPSLALDEDKRWSLTLKYGQTTDECNAGDIAQCRQSIINSTADQNNRESENGFEPNVSLSAVSLDLSTKSRDRPNYVDIVKKGVSYEDKNDRVEDWSHPVKSSNMKTSLPIGLEAKLNAILSAELSVFKTALRRTAEDQSQAELGESGEALREFLSLQQTDLELMSDLLHTYRKQQQELKYIYKQLMGTESEMKRESVERDRQMVELKVGQERKLSEADVEISRLKQEIDEMISGNKRSDVGLMKAKYKAQAEHFRRKMQSAEQLNDDLKKEMTDLRGRLMEGLPDRGLIRGAHSMTPSLVGMLPHMPSTSRLSMSSSRTACDTRGFVLDKEDERVRRRVYTNCTS